MYLEVFYLKNKKVRVNNWTNSYCSKCVFYSAGCIKTMEEMPCVAEYRKDRKNVSYECLNL